MYDKQIKGIPKLFYILFAIMFFVVLVAIFIGIKSNSNKVNATSTQFIQENEYTLSIGNVSDLSSTYVGEYPYYLTTSFNSSFISFITNGDIALCEFNYINYNNNYVSISLNRREDSTSIVYETNTSVSINGFGYFYVSQSESYGSVRSSSVGLRNIKIYLDKNYQNISNSFDSFNYMSYYYYLSDGSLKLRVQYSNTTDFSSPIMTVYLTYFYNDYPVQFGTEILVCQALRIDRSLYIDKEYIYVEVPTGEVNVFDSIVNGISSFLNINILPHFTLGNLFMIVLGVSFMGFLLHLIVK